MIPANAKKHPRLNLWATPEGDIYGPRRKRTGHFDRYGYLRLSCIDNGKHIKIPAHRVVAETFLGAASGRTVNHKDSNKLNNAVSNLEYLSAGDNTSHSFVQGRRSFCHPVTVDGVTYYSKREMERRAGISRRY